MAKVIGYWENNTEITYSQHDHAHCPAMVQPSVYDLLDAERQGWRSDKCAAVDWLNGLVLEGRIAKVGPTWEAVIKA